jgi:hypothetical protein
MEIGFPILEVTARFAGKGGSLHRLKAAFGAGFEGFPQLSGCI